MKRYAFDELTRKEDADGDYCEYDEVNEIIMNMVDEFAETAKEYEAELAKKDKLYNELYVITNEEMDKLAAKIAQLSKALEKIRTMHAGSLIGSHYRDSIVGVAREALERKST
jgi:hypothetical protein